MSLLKVDEDIYLRILEMDDAGTLFQLVDNNRQYLRTWLPWVDSNSTIEETKLFIKSTQEQHVQNFGFQCGIWYRNQLAGVVGFHRIDWANKNVELGYWLGADFQGHGIVTKACRTLIDFAFYEYELHRVQIRCATGNTKSCAIIQRLGFILEGTARQAELLYDHYVDLNIYGITADEWELQNNHQTKRVKWE